MDEIRKVVLDFVNGIRKECDLPPISELQPGICKDAAKCVIAESVLAGTSDLSIEVSPMTKPDEATPTVLIWSYKPQFEADEVNSEYSHQWSMPPEVNQFAIDFDEHKYPDLIAGHGHLAHNGYE